MGRLTRILNTAEERISKLKDRSKERIQNTVRQWKKKRIDSISDQEVWKLKCRDLIHIIRVSFQKMKEGMGKRKYLKN